MAYPPPPPLPSPTPTPMPATSGYVSPADYLESEWDALQLEDQDEMVSIHQIAGHIYRIKEVLRDAEQ